jgi:hypothetical protein
MYNKALKKWLPKVEKYVEGGVLSGEGLKVVVM